MRYWLVRRSPDRPSLFELRPLAFDEVLRDWREEAARLLAPSWLAAEALVPAGNVKRAVAEAGAWWGPRPAGLGEVAA